MTKDIQTSNLQKETDGFQFISRYSINFFELNSGETFTKGLALFSDVIYQDIMPNSFSLIDESYITQWLALEPELVIIGTGNNHEFLPAQWQTLFFQKKIGIDTMNTESACRTYSVLATEQRQALGIFFPITH